MLRNAVVGSHSRSNFHFWGTFTLTFIVIIAVYSFAKTVKKNSSQIIFLKSREVCILCILVLEHFAMSTSWQTLSLRTGKPSNSSGSHSCWESTVREIGYSPCCLLKIFLFEVLWNFTPPEKNVTSFSWLMLCFSTLKLSIKLSSYSQFSHLVRLIWNTIAFLNFSFMVFRLFFCAFTSPVLCCSTVANSSSQKHPLKPYLKCFIYHWIPHFHN